MKKILNILLIGALFGLWSCEDVTDDFEGLDEKSAVVNEVKLSGTLVAEDYIALGKIAESNATTEEETYSAKDVSKDLAFNDIWTADRLVPEMLIERYYAVDKGSSYMATYNKVVKKASYIRAYENAVQYELMDSDYALAGGDVAEKLSFFPSIPAEKHMDKILKAKYPDAAADDLVNVSYDFSPVDGASAVIFFSEDFSSYSNYDEVGQNDGWLQYLSKGTRKWQAREHSGNTYAQFGAFNSGEENEVYLITPAFDIEDNEPLFSFDVNIGYWTHAPLSVYISADFDGSDVEGATWTDITSNFTIPEEPTSNYGTFATAGQMVLKNYEGTIHIAFKYTGDGNAGLTTTVQVDNVMVKNAGIEKTENSDMYQFNGGDWKEAKGIVVLNSNDYDEMGAPGKYNNFSSSDNPDNYLPQFLNKTYPYAQEGDTTLVGYVYYSGGTQFRVDRYVRYDAIWTKEYMTLTEDSQQFVFADSKWIFDPSITFTLEKPDYQILVDYVANTPELEKYLDEAHPENTENYFGASSYYGNFGWRLSTINANDDELIGKSAAEATAVYLRRVTEEGLIVILEEKFPNSQAEVNGAQVYYNVIFKTFQEGNINVFYKAKYICTGPGKFELTDEVQKL